MAASRPDGGAAASAGTTGDAAGDLLRAAHAAGRLRYGGLDLPLAVYETGVRALSERRLRAWSLPTQGAGLLDHLRRMAGADLYLALACEHGAAGAWARLTREYGPRLTGLAVRRGADAASAETHVGDLLADLASPPPHDAARTLLGTYEGTGSLFGWLALILGRRLARSRRPAREVSAAPVADAEEAREDDRAVARGPDPSASAAAHDAARRLAATLRETWSDLTPGETLALLGKYRDGLSQQAIARLLDVSESRVSRVVGRAHEKLADAVRRRFSRDGAPDDATWEALRATVTEHLATATVPAPPPREHRAPTSPGGAP